MYEGAVNHDNYEESYSLTSQWSDELAAREFKLNVFAEYPNGERRLLRQVTGDFEWSKRIATHYEIDYEIEETK